MKAEKKIGGYRILSPLGAGGMGEVWRAEDERLGREVALKMLPAEFAGDTERMARFEREAKVLASLNHPNIAHLYGLETAPSGHPERTERVEGSPEAQSDAPGNAAHQTSGEHRRRSSDSLAQGYSDSGPVSRSSSTDTEAGSGGDGNSKFIIHNSKSTAQAVTFLVMELVEGEDLSERIARGPIPIDEAAAIARQIAEALEAAHEAGIVHRDLKPANIKLRPDGTVKVLDFGLAKAWESDASNSSLSLSPTLTQHATAAGLILGTAAYMSPEQAAGAAADRRADIWSFGVVFWEMLTGHKLFDGETISHVLASVLKDEVELDELPKTTPPKLRELIGRCLERKPRQRLQAIGDGRIVLEDYERDPESFAVPAPGTDHEDVRPTRVRSIFPWVVAAATTVLFLVSGWLATRPDDDERRVLRAEISPPEETVFSLQAIAPGAAQISPDGSKIVFGAVDSEGKRLLWIRRIKDSVARPLPGTDGGAYPFWAPDSRQVGFFAAGGKLRKIDTSGGPPVTICMARNGKGGAWNDKDEILFAPTHDASIYLVSAGGGRTGSGNRDVPGHHKPQASDLASGWAVSLSRAFRGWPRRGPGHGGIDRDPGPGPRVHRSRVEHRDRG